jgi:hypothetical protein
VCVFVCVCGLCLCVHGCVVCACVFVVNALQCKQPGAG